MNEVAIILGKGVLGLVGITLIIGGLFLIVELCSRWADKYKWFEITFAVLAITVLIFGFGSMMHYGGF